MKLHVSLILASAIVATHAAEDQFALNVRTTEPLTPADEQKTFTLPPGFEIQLVGCEPDINKPMNMAFDATGRLWVTTSIEYPFAAPTNRPSRDRLMIFEDFGPDGRARKVTEFADNLNVPNGIYPFRTDEKHWKAVVWSLPNIWLLEDTDGDGKADQRTPLYGPFDFSRDLHGNQSSFTRGFDGWLYATHGFNNDSHVTAGDGSHVDLNSGNTYRMRLDRSHIEQHTHGQVNPFGLAWDERGNLYSSDCHSAPIYQLLNGGYYPSFGKPDDGLGFAPVMMHHAHGSTAIDGAFYYSDDLWPDEYQDNFLIGNVMTSRLNHDKIVFHGSTPKAIEQPDFMTTTDPWFRPVNNLLGPDGAIYVADFYNRIIGHYEVPLNHPGRDHIHGRIWRIVYTGDHAKQHAGATSDAEGASQFLRSPKLPSDLDGLIAEFGSPNLTRRFLAMNEIEDRFGSKAVPKLLPMANGQSTFGNPQERRHKITHALWMLERFGVLPSATLAKAELDQDPIVRTHALRILASQGEVDPSHAGDSIARVQREHARACAAGIKALSDSDALVRRCAAEVLGAWPDAGNIQPLLDTLAMTDAEDTHLVYVLRKAIRDQLNDNAIFAEIARRPLSARDALAIADVAVAVKSEQAGSFLIAHRESFANDEDLSRRALQHAASYAPPSALDKLATSIQADSKSDVDFQLALFRAIRDGFVRRGVELTPTLEDWAGKLALQLLGSVEGSSGWVNEPLDDNSNPANPWAFQDRVQSDTGKPGRLLSSFPNGEPLTGRLISKPFAAPAHLKFFLAGHDGYPDKPAQGKNHVLLRDAETGDVIATAQPPRNDVAQPISWDLSAHAGKQVRLEVVDGDTAGAYAWLAFGRFDPEVVPFPTVGPATVVDRQVAAAELAGISGELASDSRLKDQLADLMRNENSDVTARAAAMRALSARGSGIADLVSDRQTPFTWKSRILNAATSENEGALRDLRGIVFKEAPQRVQVRVAMLSTDNGDDAMKLVSEMESGAVPPSLLRDRNLRNKLENIGGAETRARAKDLIAKLPDFDADLQRLIDQRRREYPDAKTDRAAGEQLFTQVCAACHQLGGKGALVGPQLDGIGNRGLERICEDVLDPNRNVDRAFATTTLVLKNGDVESGLFRREEGAVLVLANAAGKEFTVNKSDVSERHETTTSLMPANFGEAFTPQQFDDLLSFLLSQRK